MSQNKQADQANHANVLNPEHPAYHRSRGDSPEVAQQKAKAQRDTNHRAAAKKG